MSPFHFLAIATCARDNMMAPLQGHTHYWTNVAATGHGGRVFLRTFFLCLRSRSCGTVQCVSAYSAANTSNMVLFPSFLDRNTVHDIFSQRKPQLVWHPRRQLCVASEFLRSALNLIVFFLKYAVFFTQKNHFVIHLVCASLLFCLPAPQNSV